MGFCCGGAFFLEASEGNLRQCRFGAGSPLKRTALHGFGDFDRGSEGSPFGHPSNQATWFSSPSAG